MAEPAAYTSGWTPVERAYSMWLRSAWEQQGTFVRLAAAVVSHLCKTHGLRPDAVLSEIGVKKTNGAAINRWERRPSLRKNGQQQRGIAQASQLIAEAERADKAQRESADAYNAQPEQLTDEAVTARPTADRNQATPLVQRSLRLTTRPPKRGKPAQQLALPISFKRTLAAVGVAFA